MLPKPPGCVGCPLYGDGRGFVPDRIPDGALVVVLAQNPGADEEAGRQVTGYEGREPTYEECEPQPLIGKTGYEMWTRYVPLLGVSPERVGVGNVLKCRAIKGWHRTNDLPTGKTLEAAVAHCTREHLRIPPETPLVLTMGALSWRVLGGPGSVTEWRGFLRPIPMQPEV